MSSNTLPPIKTQFKPIQLKGHERAITTVKYNADGDLLFTASKDQKPCVWFAETGERLGTFNQHKGAVWDLDPSWDSRYLLTACADASVRLFEATTGRYLAKMNLKGVGRAVCWGEGTEHFIAASDPFHSHTQHDKGCISIYHFADIPHPPPTAFDDESVPLVLPRKEIVIKDPTDKVTCLGWTYADEYIIAGFDSGFLVKYDPHTGAEFQRALVHPVPTGGLPGSSRINRISFNREKTLLVTSSKDYTAKLIDPMTLEEIKVYKTDRPVNGAVISPTHPHIIMGGGQEAMNVTTTAGSQGKFESRFFHMVYEKEEFGRVKGHFGPINAIDVHPFGKSYASGSEDGFVRLHHFDQVYLSTSDMIPDGVDKDGSGSADEAKAEGDIVGGATAPNSAVGAPELSVQKPLKK